MEATTVRTWESISGRPGQPEAADLPRRPAWVEVDLGQLRRNCGVIRHHTPPGVALLAVVKDEAYGHGATTVARMAAEAGFDYLAVSTLDEAIQLRRENLPLPILLFGERFPEELPHAFDPQFRICLNSWDTAQELERLGRQLRQTARVHVKIDTGMSRYGVRWTEAPELLEHLTRLQWVRVEGIFSHFAMSDEEDKSFAWLQLNRFQEVLDHLARRKLPIPSRHMCNSGGFLDLPEAHFDMVRLGILPLGVYPSKVCHRLPGIAPVMSVKCRLAALQSIQPGDTVGYGMRYRAESPRTIGVLPLGYGDGFPRLRNQGWVLLHGQRAPIVGANAMDAIMIDLTHLPQARVGDETVLMGRQGSEEISVHDIAEWGRTVSYQVLCGWRARLPRVFVESQP